MNSGQAEDFRCCCEDPRIIVNPGHHWFIGFKHMICARSSEEAEAKVRSGAAKMVANKAIHDLYNKEAMKDCVWQMKNHIEMVPVCMMTPEECVAQWGYNPRLDPVPPILKYWNGNIQDSQTRGHKNKWRP